ncbi:hypothetical protein Vadar_016152 [Vaccinium darrowii]|uniref:Uncharacterized protein n=1 Tax=Vaccinium darrowii TaxID=229202 RepID=A0ACB7ZJV3_9ERIC|nr:hypothetical protein Vadar_016152 [Vaccinium darrowii]
MKKKGSPPIGWSLAGPTSGRVLPTSGHAPHVSSSNNIRQYCRFTSPLSLGFAPQVGISGLGLYSSGKLHSFIGSGYQSSNLAKGGFYPKGNFSSFINQNKNGSNTKNPSEEEHLVPTIRRDLYNLEDFQTQYENAKFFVIKSYSEDAIHKCIKSDFWSSTPNGNTKLDAAFHDAEAKTIETGTKCPIFLFFSVNGSGQFVGVSEMLGSVDFNKDMDLGQLDKRNGFFPVKWHVIKDVPNPQLRHITLENNDNRPVTFTRDTQEVGLKQGIEMLNIFKSYTAKTSILDDFNFYENREKLLKTKWSGEQASSPTEIYSNHDFAKNLKTGEMTAEAGARPNGASDPTSSLVNLTKNLSLSSHPASSSKKRNSHPPKNGERTMQLMNGNMQLTPGSQQETGIL